MSTPNTPVPPVPPVPDRQTAASEPLLTVGTITAVVTALVALLVAFGIPLTDDQRTAIIAALAAVAPLVAAVWGRTKVYSPRSVVKLLDAYRYRRRP